MLLKTGDEVDSYPGFHCLQYEHSSRNQKEVGSLERGYLSFDKMSKFYSFPDLYSLRRTSTTWGVTSQQYIPVCILQVCAYHSCYNIWCDMAALPIISLVPSLISSFYRLQYIFMNLKKAGGGLGTRLTNYHNCALY